MNQPSGTDQSETRASPADRLEFIKDMYRVYWSNMARSMDGVWKVLAPITVAGTIVAAVHRDYLPAPLGISLAILVIVWGINVTIDLNAWHRRNLFFATKAELQFLSAEDYGRLLPPVYARPKQEWITFYMINAFVFAAFLGMVVVYAAFWKLTRWDWALPTLVFGIGLLFTVTNWRRQERRAKQVFQELFGA